MIPEIDIENEDMNIRISDGTLLDLRFGGINHYDCQAKKAVLDILEEADGAIRLVKSDIDEEYQFAFRRRCINELARLLKAANITPLEFAKYAIHRIGCAIEFTSRNYFKLDRSTSRRMLVGDIPDNYRDMEKYLNEEKIRKRLRVGKVLMTDIVQQTLHQDTRRYLFSNDEFIKEYFELLESNMAKKIYGCESFKELRDAASYDAVKEADDTVKEYFEEYAVKLAGHGVKAAMEVARLSQFENFRLELGSMSVHIWHNNGKIKNVRWGITREPWLGKYDYNIVKFLKSMRNTCMSLELEDAFKQLYSHGITFETLKKQCMKDVIDGVPITMYVSGCGRHGISNLDWNRFFEKNDSILRKYVICSMEKCTAKWPEQLLEKRPIATAMCDRYCDGYRSGRAEPVIYDCPVKGNNGGGA